jgi:DNA-binding NtrC family response regulator
MKKRILLVEDNIEFAEALKDFIDESTDFEVIHFSNAKKALEYLTKNTEGLAGVISDILMRHMDGVDFIKEIRRTSGGSEIPVLFLSGTERSVVSALLAPYNISGFLEKPVDMRRILRAIETHFQPNVAASVAKAA